MKLYEKIGYGLGDTASSIFWKLFGVYLMYFYTDIVGIDVAVAGTMFLVTRIWDSFFDPIVGIITDRTETRWGKFRPYLLWMAIPFGVMGVLTFSSPEFTLSWKTGFAYLTYSLMMMVYSLINVPYGTLLGVLSDDPQERVSLSSYKMAFAAGGSILALALIEPLVELFGGESAGAGSWTRAVSVLAVLSVTLFFITFALTKERVRPVSEKSHSLKSDFLDLMKNVPWWILLGGGICVLLFNSIREGGAVYYFKYYVLSQDAVFSGIPAVTLFLVLGQAFNIAGIILIPYVSARVGKKGAFILMMSIVAVLSGFFWFIGPGDIVMMMVLQSLISLAAGGIMPLLWSMYADVADWSEWKTGRRATGLVFSSSSMSQKLGWSLGGAMTGWLLFLFGFEPNVEQTETAIRGIRLMQSVLPACASAAAVIFMIYYPLGEKMMAKVSSSLKEQRSEAEMEEA